MLNWGTLTRLPSQIREMCTTWPLTCWRKALRLTRSSLMWSTVCSVHQATSKTTSTASRWRTSMWCRLRSLLWLAIILMRIRVLW